jgi:hypothetical protein
MEIGILFHVGGIPRDRVVVSATRLPVAWIDDRMGEPPNHSFPVRKHGTAEQSLCLWRTYLYGSFVGSSFYGIYDLHNTNRSHLRTTGTVTVKDNPLFTLRLVSLERSRAPT